MGRARGRLLYTHCSCTAGCSASCTRGEKSGPPNTKNAYNKHNKTFISLKRSNSSRSVRSFSVCVATSAAAAMGNEATVDEDHGVEASRAAKNGPKWPKKKRPSNRGGYLKTFFRIQTAIFREMAQICSVRTKYCAFHRTAEVHEQLCSCTRVYLVYCTSVYQVRAFRTLLKCTQPIGRSPTAVVLCVVSVHLFVRIPDTLLRWSSVTFSRRPLERHPRVHTRQDTGRPRLYSYSYSRS